MKEAIKLITEFEGFESKPYRCPAGVWTIGIGFTRWNGRPVTTLTKPITRTQAEYALERQLVGFQAELDSAVTAPLTSNQNDALLSLIFNIGSPAFRKSTLLRKLNMLDYAGAADQFLVWDKATVNGKKVSLRGLTRRRKAEQDLFLKG